MDLNFTESKSHGEIEIRGKTYILNYNILTYLKFNVHII